MTVIRFLLTISYETWSVVSMNCHSVQKLFFEEQKYELAKVMGADFAPKVRILSVSDVIV